MARTNILDRSEAPRTHEGAPASRINQIQALRRSVLSCLLWEKEFYEDGEAIADRILALSKEVTPEQLMALAIEAREVFHLRHVPLLLLVALLGRRVRSKAVGDTIATVVAHRADEPGELLSLYWKINGAGKPLPSQLKRGLALAFPHFDAYELGKYDRDSAVKLRDVMFLSHPKPFPNILEAEETIAPEINRAGYRRGSTRRGGSAQAIGWEAFVEGKLAAPDTWEVALSAGADKRETWIRLLSENRLGYLALLRNLRNMSEADVPQGLIETAIRARRGAQNVLPFRYIAALRAAPRYYTAINDALVASVETAKPVPGTTNILVDVSGSMNAPLSAKSDLKRIDAACALAAVWPGQKRVFAFSQEMREVAAYPGMALVDAIQRSMPHSSTYLGAAVGAANRIPADRLVVITDEQSHDPVPNPVAKGYMINVASAKNGVGYGAWTHIDGFSEAVVRYISEVEYERYYSDLGRSGAEALGRSDPDNLADL